MKGATVGRKPLFPASAWERVDWNQTARKIAADLNTMPEIRATGQTVRVKHVYNYGARLGKRPAYRGTGHGRRVEWQSVDWDRESLQQVASRLGVSRSRACRVRKQIRGRQ